MVLLTQIEGDLPMALFEDMFKGGNIITGLAIGIGATIVAPAVIPVLRPLAKSVIKAGLIAYDQSKVVLAEFNEHTGDIVAEVRSELADSGSSEAPGSNPAHSST
jgi:Protein of unknown function (DUF5132)